jgi:hypothetical protein
VPAPAGIRYPDRPDFHPYGMRDAQGISVAISRVVQCRPSIDRRISMLELNLVYTRIKDMQGRLADLGRYL